MSATAMKIVDAHTFEICLSANLTDKCSDSSQAARLSISESSKFVQLKRCRVERCFESFANTK